MAQIDKCKGEIEAAIGRALTPREIGGIGREAAKLKGKIDTAGGDKIRAQAIMKSYLEDRETQRAARKAAAAVSAEKFASKTERFNQIGKFADANPAEAAKSFMLSSEKPFAGAKDSLGINLDRAGADGMQKFIAAIHGAGLQDYAFDRGDEENMWMARAALEQGQDATKYGKNAVAMAQIIKKMQDTQLAKIRNAGIAKGHLDNYTQAQIHDSYQLARAGDNPFGSEASFQQWASDIMPKMDWNKSFGGEFVNAPAAEKMARLKSQWQQFVQGEHLRWSDSNKTIQSREILFNSPKDGFDYHMQYGGNRSFVENVWHQLGRGARQIALADEWGPNAESNIRKFYDTIHKRVIESEGEGSDKAVAFKKMKDNVLDKYMPSYLGQLAGAATGPTRWLMQLRGLLASAKVGASLPTLFMDTAQRAAQIDRYGGRSSADFFGGLHKAISDQFHGLSKEDRIQRAAGGGILLQGAGMPVTDAAREYAGPGVAGRLALSLMRHGGHNFWTDRMRINVLTHEGFLHWSDREKTFDQLPAGRQALFKMFGLNDKEWDVIRGMEGVELPKGQRSFMPDDINHMPKEKFAGLANGDSDKALWNARDNVFRKYRNLMGEMADRSTVAPSSEMRAVLAQGTKSGTAIGEIVRSFGELKGFLYNYMKNHAYGGIVGADEDPMNVGWGRALARMATGKGTSSAYGQMARLTASMVGLAYIKNTLQDVAAGKTPENPVGEHWSDAMLRAFGGGALGPMSDLLMSQTYLSNDAKWPDYVGMFAGPTVETMGDLGTSVMSMAKHGAKYATDEGYDSDRLFHDLGVDTSHLASSAYRSVPYNNLLWTKWATDYLVYDNMMDYMNPGYKQRVQAKMQKDRGQSLILGGDNGGN